MNKRQRTYAIAAALVFGVVTCLICLWGGSWIIGGAHGLELWYTFPTFVTAVFGFIGGWMTICAVADAIKMRGR